jgi:hypothetical protein
MIFLVSLLEIGIYLILTRGLNFGGIANLIGLFLWLFLWWVINSLCSIVIFISIFQHRVGLRLVASILAVCPFLIGAVNLWRHFQSFWSGWLFTFGSCAVVVVLVLLSIVVAFSRSDLWSDEVSDKPL